MDTTRKPQIGSSIIESCGISAAIGYTIPTYGRPTNFWFFRHKQDYVLFL